MPPPLPGSSVDFRLYFFPQTTHLSHVNKLTGRHPLCPEGYNGGSKEDEEANFSGQPQGGEPWRITRGFGWRYGNFHKHSPNDGWHPIRWRDGRGAGWAWLNTMRVLWSIRSTPGPLRRTGRREGGGTGRVPNPPPTVSGRSPSAHPVPVKSGQPCTRGTLKTPGAGKKGGLESQFETTPNVDVAQGRRTKTV